MVIKRKVDKLTEDLTGREIAFLSIQHMEDIDHDREPAYTQEEIHNTLQKIGEKDPYQFYVFQKWNDIYQLLRFYVENSKVIALRAKDILNRLIKLFSAKTKDWLINMNKIDIPIPMTEKEYKDKKELQREIELNEYHCIYEVIAERASRMVEEEKDDLSGDDYYPEFVEENYPEYYKRAKNQINEMINNDLLTPVEKGTIKENKTNKELGDYNKRLKALAKKMEFKELKKIENCFFDNISPWSAEENLENNSSEDWLYQTYIKGKELYQAELPEWEKWINEYRLNWYNFQKDESNWSLYKEEIGIVKNPDPSNLDKKGWYKKEKLLNDPLGQREIEHNFLNEAKKEGVTIQEVLETNRDWALFRIQGYKGTINILEKFSKIIGGIDLTENLSSYTQELKEIIKDYNKEINPSESTKFFIGKNIDNTEELKLEKLRIEEFRNIPLNETDIKQMRQLFTPILGDNWWEKEPEEVTINE